MGSDTIRDYKLHITFGRHWEQCWTDEPADGLNFVDFGVTANYIDLTSEVPTISTRELFHDRNDFVSDGPETVRAIFSSSRILPDAAVASFAPVLSRFSRILARGSRFDLRLPKIELFLFEVTPEQVEAVDSAVLEFFFPTSGEDVTLTATVVMASDQFPNSLDISNSSARALWQCLEWLRTCPEVYQFVHDADPLAVNEIIMARSIAVSPPPRTERDLIGIYLFMRKMNSRRLLAATAEALETVKAAAAADDDQCCICLDSYKETSSPDDDAVRTPCSHVFHRRCILEWLRRRTYSCPYCRTPLPKTLIIYS